MKSASDILRARFQAVHTALQEHRSVAQTYADDFNDGAEPATLVPCAEELLKQAERLLYSTRLAAQFIDDHANDIVLDGSGKLKRLV